ncbi:hypothetical protein NL108_011436 [Boleophthalmus pectinirostris]|nr:hypothetical protein NL108_011436 [Boleophthalmus pectinirostris]
MKVQNKNRMKTHRKCLKMHFILIPVFHNNTASDRKHPFQNKTLQNVQKAKQSLCRHGANYFLLYTLHRPIRTKQKKRLIKRKTKESPTFQNKSKVTDARGFILATLKQEAAI